MAVTSHDLRLGAVLGRLEMIIDNENSRIGSDPQFDIKTSNTHKSRCLYELTMLFRDTRPADMPPTFAAQMRDLKGKLMANARKVEAHMEAVRAVADILRNAAREADADGTYSKEQFHYSDF